MVETERPYLHVALGGPGKAGQARPHCQTSYSDGNFNTDAAVCGLPAGRSSRKNHGVETTADTTSWGYVRASTRGGEGMATMASTVSRNGDERSRWKCLG